MPTIRRTLVPALGAALTLLAGRATGHPPANGHVIVSTRGDASVVLLDPATFTETARLVAPAGLHEIAATPDGRRAIGAAYGSGPRHQTPDQRLVVLHLPDLVPGTDDALTLGPVIDLGPGHTRPNDLVFFPDSRHVLCTSEVARSVLKIDLDADPAPAVVGEYAFGARAGHMLAALPDLARCYVPSVVDRTVSVIDLESGIVVAAPEAGNGAEGVAAAPDGSSVWIACHRDNTIAVLDPATNTIARTMVAPGTPFRVRFTPDSARVVVSFPGGDEVRVFDATTFEVVHAVPLTQGAAPTSIAVSPDGRFVAVVCAGHESLALIDLGTGEIVARAAVGPTPDGLAWAPAPSTVAPD